MSYADNYTDEMLAELERKITQVYYEAQKDLERTAKEYFAKFEKRDVEYKKLIDSGKITEKEYKQWRLNQIGRGERFNKMAADMAERATKANEVAVAYVNDATPSIYSLNRNHEAYVIEKLGYDMSADGDFALYNEATVRRLIVTDPDIMPYYPPARAVKRGIDLEYGQKYIKKHVKSGILQGKSVYKIADDLQRDVTNMNRASAIRTARTAVTSAQNGGRQDSMNAAAKMGIKLLKRWVSAKDKRVRDEHGAADGQTVDIDKPFNIGGEKMMFPGDGTSASGWNLYNCRCGMRTVEKEGIEAEKRQIRVRNPETGRNELVEDMTYEEWAKIKSLNFDNYKKKHIKTVDSSKKSDIIKVNKGQMKPYTKVKVEDIPSMDEKRFLKMKSNLEKQGVSVIQDENGDEYLKAMNAEAMTLSDGSAVIFQSRRVPSASAAFEEIIHVAQIRKKGPINIFGNEKATIERLNREIEANEKVMRNKKAYGLTDKDVESVQENLDMYYKQLKEVTADV